MLKIGWRSIMKLNSMAKGLVAGASIVGGIAAAGAGTLLASRLSTRKTCKEFYEQATRQMVMPGLKDGFDPQDLFYVESADVWLFSGYNVKDKGKLASPIYVARPDGKAAKVTIELPNGVVYRGHGAAVCARGEYAFLTVKDGYVVMSLTELLDAADGSVIKAFAHVPIELEPAFMNMQDGVLYIGEFYHKRFYNTPQSHWLKCPDGTTNPALMYAYEPSDEPGALFGFEPRPSKVYSIPGDIQGMCVAEYGRIVLSKSWGFGDAHLLVYDLAAHDAKGIDHAPGEAPTLDLDGDAGGIALASEGQPSDVQATHIVAGEEVPVEYLCSDSLEKAVLVPPMAEGIDYHDGQVWLANESASNLYVIGKVNAGKYVYSISV